MTSNRTFSDLSDTQPSRAWNPLTLALLAGLWIAALPNWPLWRALLALPETSSTRGALFVIGFGLMIAALTALLLTLLAWRPTIKPAIAALLLAAAFGAHFMGSYGVVIDTTMMINVLQTDPREVRDLLNLRLLGSVLLLAGVPLLLLWRAPVRGVGVLRQGGRNLLGLVVLVLLLAALLLALYADLSATMRNHRTMRYLINPVNSLYALVDLGVKSQARPSGPPLPIGADARIVPRAAGAKAPMLVLVVGETARADHFALNGYARPTNPALAMLDVTTRGTLGAIPTIPRSFSRESTSPSTAVPCISQSRPRIGRPMAWMRSPGRSSWSVFHAPSISANHTAAPRPPGFAQAARASMPPGAGPRKP